MPRTIQIKLKPGAKPPRQHPFIKSITWTPKSKAERDYESSMAAIRAEVRWAKRVSRNAAAAADRLEGKGRDR